MSKQIGRLFIALVFEGWILTAHASLIGDTVTIGRYIFGGVVGDGSCCGPFDVVVQAGNADSTPVSSGNNLFVDVEANSIRFIFGPGPGSGGTYSGDEHVIRVDDLDWLDDPTKTITDFNVVTNFASITPERISFDQHSITLQISQLNWGRNDGYFAEVFLEPVPTPASIPLVGIGLVAIGFSHLTRRHYI